MTGPEPSHLNRTKFNNCYKVRSRNITHIVDTRGTSVRGRLLIESWWLLRTATGLEVVLTILVSRRADSQFLGSGTSGCPYCVG